MAIHVVVQPYTPLFLPRKPLPSQLFWLHVSTFPLIISRCCCQISFRPVFKSSLHLVTGTTFYVLISLHSCMNLQPGIVCGIVCSLSQGIHTDVRKISCMLLHRTTGSILCSANLTGSATNKKEWAPSGRYPTQTTMLKAQQSRLFSYSLLSMKATEFHLLSRAIHAAFSPLTPTSSSNLLQEQQQLKHPQIRMVSAGWCLSWLFLDITGYSSTLSTAQSKNISHFTLLLNQMHFTFGFLGALVQPFCSGLFLLSLQSPKSRLN